MKLMKAVLFPACLETTAALIKSWLYSHNSELPIFNLAMRGHHPHKIDWMSWHRNVRVKTLGHDHGVAVSHDTNELRLIRIRVNKLHAESWCRHVVVNVLVAEYHGFMPDATKPAATHANNSGGIREQIPKKYIARYQHWKQEFLATITGREQWAFYQNNPNFTLTVVISRDNPEGGMTSNYEWNEDGKLVAATITLGCRIDEGVPNPIYFPVMNSLLPTDTAPTISRETLAATKMAHELGHVNRTAKTDSVLYQLQLKLMPQYNQILLSNGRDTSDLRLVELAQRMGATPVEIWEDREYWGETNAMLYLRDRFADKGFRCVLFNRIKRSVDLYAKDYEERFLNIAESTPPPRCGW